MKVNPAQKKLGDQSDKRIVAHSIDGTPLTRVEYLKVLEYTESEIESGDFISHDQVVKASQEWI